MSSYNESVLKQAFEENRKRILDRTLYTMSLQGRTTQQLADHLRPFGVSRTTVYRWMKDGFPDYEAALPIPGWLNIPLYWWIFGEDLNSDRDPRDESLLDMFNQLNEHRKQLLINIATQLVQNEQRDAVDPDDVMF
jgi:hypothetical protein